MPLSSGGGGGVPSLTGSPLTGWYVSPDELARSAKEFLKIDAPERSAVAAPQF